MGFPIGLNRVFLGAFLALVLLLAVFTRVVFLDPGEVPECPGMLVVDAGRLGAKIDLSLHFFRGFLLELPRKVVSSSMEL